LTPLLNSNPKIGLNDGNVEIAMSCMQKGSLRLLSNLPLVNDLNSDGLQLYVNVVAGLPDTSNSYGQIVKAADNTQITDVISAGTTVRWQIFAFDSVNNPIRLISDSADNGIPNFAVSYLQDGVLQNLYDIKVDATNSYYYVDLLVTKAGAVKFFSFYRNQQIKSSLNTIMVREIDPSFTQSELFIYSDTDFSFLSYDGDSFDQYITSQPSFLIKLFDIYGNSVQQWPNWNMTLYITGDELDYSHRIQLCQ